MPIGLTSRFMTILRPIRIPVLTALLVLSLPFDANAQDQDRHRVQDRAQAEAQEKHKAEARAELIFNGVDLTGWVGDTDGYAVQDSAIVCLEGKGRNLYFDREISDFELSLEFNLSPGANNGIGIRAERDKDAAYYGMEIQVIDNLAPRWAEIEDWQAHGSIYGVVAAKRGHLRPAGEWNRQIIRAEGNQITVTLNGAVIVDVDIAEASSNGIPQGREHPGLFNESGYIGFLGHGDRVAYRRIRLLELVKATSALDQGR